MPNRIDNERIDNDSPDLRYDVSSYGKAVPDYIAIMVDRTNSSTYYNTFEHNIVLDDPAKNTSIGAGACSVLNLCVPTIYVPKATLELVNSQVDANGKPTDKEYQIAEEVIAIANSVLVLPNEILLTSKAFAVGEIILGNPQDLVKLGYKKHTAILAEELPDKDFGAITKISEPVVTNSNVPCRPETVYVPPIPPKETDWKDSEYDKLKAQLDDLLGEIPEPDKIVKTLSNADLTERTVDGHGVFDEMASALFNQLNYARNNNLINNGDMASIYSQSLVQAMQMAVQFALERDKVFWMNKLQYAQVLQANLAAKLAKAEILMLPAKMELAYAQLEIQKQQVELTKYQVEVQKLQIPQLAAQLDQTREQTALICVQRKHALEQLAQSELDRKIKQAQIEAAVLGIKGASVDVLIKEHQANQSELQTQILATQVEQSKEEVKIKNTQWQLGLKQIKLAEAQLKQIAAELKLKAQQLLKDREHTMLIKAQTATQYAQVAATSEALKAAKAQYSDTIEGAKVGGILGAQIAVNKMQAECLDRDSMFKFTSLVKDGWSAKKTADIAVLSPNAFTAFGLDRIINFYGTKYFNLADDIFAQPVNYVDYMSDEQLDGTVSTSNPTNSIIK